MVPLIAATNHLFFLQGLRLGPYPLHLAVSGKRVLVCKDIKISNFGFVKFGLRSRHWCCFCKAGWDSEGDYLALEAEILEFMKGTEKPEAFPTREELVEAGRTDLAEAIVKRGGWLSMGWDLEVEERQNEVRDRDYGDKKENGRGNGRVGDDYGEVVGDIDDRAERFEDNSSWTGCSHSPSVSGRSLEASGEEEDTGVEGILSRLEKQRNISFSANLGSKPLSGCNSDDWRIKSTGDVDSDHLTRSRKLSFGSSKGTLTNSDGKYSPSMSLSDVDNSWCPEMFSTWKLPQAGVSTAKFEAGEIVFDEDHEHRVRDTPKDGFQLSITEDSSEVLYEKRNNSHSDIRMRLQHLEHELKSALCSLRSKSKEFISNESLESSTDLRKLSDELEFQETEIMNAKDSLRAIRAKLAVLEGKMTLATIDSKKTVEEKQKKIDGAHRALQLLRKTCVVWPNSASEVLLVGSFDGWSNQRRMKKSSSGIFSVELRLYPGRYEIKFIVDGVWKIDPLRPIVKNNGYENNLFIVT